MPICLVALGAKLSCAGLSTSCIQKVTREIYRQNPQILSNTVMKGPQEMLLRLPSTRRKYKQEKSLRACPVFTRFP